MSHSENDLIATTIWFIHFFNSAEKVRFCPRTLQGTWNDSVWKWFLRYNFFSQFFSSQKTGSSVLTTKRVNLFSFKILRTFSSVSSTDTFKSVFELPVKQILV